MMKTQSSHRILIDCGHTEWKIVIKDQASAVETHAAQELRHFLEEISGVRLPVVDDQGELSSQEIILGENRHLVESGISLVTGKLGSDGFIIRTTEDSLVIVGGSPRGTLYGVYSFLEEYMGIRWFSSKVSRIPKRKQITIPDIDVEQTPPLEYREPFFFDAFDGDWAARNKMKGNFQRLEEKHGGKMHYSSLFVHTFDHFVSVKQYFDEHPEYFSEVNGKRISEHTQLCLTNPDVVRITVQNVRKWIEQNPGIGIVSVSQNDCYNPCQCANCRAIDEAEGSHSGSLIHFVNQVAEEIEHDHPELAIDTIAYQYTRKPPKTIRPRKNVIVRLCDIECCFSHPLKNCRELGSFRARSESGHSFKDDLAGWSKVCDRIFVWDYVTNFWNYVMPFPNLRVLQPNIKFFIENHVTGIFEQGSYAEGGGGEFAELRAYLLAKLLWNPDYNVDLAINEFLAGYYGMAAAPLREYIDFLHDKVEREGIHMGIYDAPTNLYLSAEVIDKAIELFDRAEMLADDEETLVRVRAARLPIRYVQLSIMSVDEPKRIQLVQQFFEDLKAAGITQIWESRTLDISRWNMEEATIVIHPY